MRYLSVCSGIEAASCAWHPLGWKPVAFSEIEKFPSAVLAHHYPDVPNLGDMTKFHEWPNLDINLLVGGTPCQAFSVAGLRQGLSDPRGNLTLTFLGLADRYRPEWVVWENVPGVLSDRTNAFGQFLAGLGQLGYGWAYRMLDAQYFGVAQRRRRMFVVGCLGGWERAAAVLFEPESLRGDSPPSREAGKGVAPCLAARTKGGGGLGTDFDCDGGCIPIQEPGKRTGSSTSDRSYGIGLGESGDPMFTLQSGAVHGVASVAPCVKSNQGKNSDAAMEAASLVAWPAVVAPTLDAHFGEKQGMENQHINSGAGLFVPTWWDGGDTAATVTTRSAHQEMPDKGNLQCIIAPTVTSKWAKGSGGPAGSECGNLVNSRMSVRRLTPTECERLQGFPDGHTNIPWRNKPAAPDGPRYKALGNSMAVPCMAWIGKRIQYISSLEDLDA